MIAVVIPSYRVKNHVLNVISRVGSNVSKIYVVDDKCPEQSGAFVAQNCTDPRVKVIYHAANQGVGGATLTGFRQAQEDGCSIAVKVDGDGQMPPEFIPELVIPVERGLCDYAKGNRFFSPDNLRGMPWIRLIGNSALSFISKISSGCWRIMDPTNGFVAIHTKVLRYLDLDKIDKTYFFESDMLFRLNTIRALILDVPMNAHYADEKSSLRVSRILLPFAWKHLLCFSKRIVYNYFLRDFNFASAQMILSIPLLAWGIWFGLSEWIRNSAIGQVTPTGTVMLAVLPVLIGFQLLLSAINYDMSNEVRTPLHRQL